MFVRLRWFTLGVLASLGLVAYVANQLLRMRERLTPENLGRGAARSVAGVLATLADRISPRDRLTKSDRQRGT